MEKNAVMDVSLDKNFGKSANFNLYGNFPDLEKAIARISPQELEEKVAKIQKLFLDEGLQDIFGLTLIHKHFPIREGEVMVESIDYQNRKEVIQPKKMEELKGLESNLVQTTWKFGGDNILCIRICFGGNGHKVIHDPDEEIDPYKSI